MALLQRVPIVVLLIWLISVAILYLFAVDISQSTVPYNFSAESSGLVDGIVMIAAGKMAEDTMVDFSISSIRKIGRWHGRIFIITDRPDCFSDIVKLYNVNIIAAPVMNSIIDVKALKTKLFDYLPDYVDSLLYMDVDILITRSFNNFFKDLHSMLSERTRANQRVIVAANSTMKVHERSYDLGMFLDAGGHFVGFCSGCEKWHSGVIWMRRSSGGSCLRAWERILRSGKFNTDQESIDEAERQGFCPRMLTLPFRHLLFAKDYLMLIFRSGQTFTHLTAAGRIETQDIFYKNVVVPKLRASLHPPLDLKVLKRKKMCTPRKKSS